MATKVAQKRLQKEYLAMTRSPPPFIWAAPEEKNILDWHFIIRGPPDSPYAGGEYHGLIMFPNDYPFKPPDVKLFTPSGRFEPGVKICMSMTSYHPSTWNAAWSVSTILTGLLSFMLSDEVTTGGVRTTNEQRKLYAERSHAFNLTSRKFKEVFPDYATTEMRDVPDMGVPPAPTAPDSQAAPAAPTVPAVVNPPPELKAVPIRPAGAPANGWMPGWRWLIAAIAVLVLGRLSSLAGI